MSLGSKSQGDVYCAAAWLQKQGPQENQSIYGKSHWRIHALVGDLFYILLLGKGVGDITVEQLIR